LKSGINTAGRQWSRVQIISVHLVVDQVERRKPDNPPISLKQRRIFADAGPLVRCSFVTVASILADRSNLTTTTRLKRIRSAARYPVDLIGASGRVRETAIAHGRFSHAQDQPHLTARSIRGWLYNA